MDVLFQDAKTGIYNSEINIHAIRIVYHLAYHLKEEQWLYKNNTNEFRDKFDSQLKTDHTDYHTFQFKLSDMSLNNNLGEVKKAFDFLSNYEFGWHVSKSAKGKKVEAKFGFIMWPVFGEGGYVQFQLPLYWMKVLIKMDLGFNKSIYSLPYNTSKVKHFFFHYWLIRLPSEGTTIRVSLFQEKFSLNYKSNYELERGFLKKMKKLMDLYSNYSFNYSFENTKLKITRYVNNTVLLHDNMTSEDLDYQVKRTQRLQYLKRRHSLGTNQIKILRNSLNSYKKYELFEEAYELLKLKCREKDIKLTDLEGIVFLGKLQDIIHYIIDRDSTEEPKFVIVTS